MSFQVIYRQASGTAQSPVRIVEQPTGREISWANRYLDREYVRRLAHTSLRLYAHDLLHFVRWWAGLHHTGEIGAFSGKDPSKVDRSAAYAMRWVAKNVVAAGLAECCETQVAYAIGKAKPVGLFVECFGTEQVPVERIQDAVLEVFDLRPAAIIRDLDLLRPIYSQTAAYGHFGREEPDFSWERTDRTDALRSVAGL
jgi:hypothetical protein